jgi:glycosyltransferase involved in cell wall biosynthesis
MITTFYPPYNFGGDGIFVHRLSNELARRGHGVDVIHCVDSYRLLAGQEPAGTYADHPNVTVHGLRSPFRFLSPLATQQTGYPLFKSDRIRQILEKGFDVIHYHNVSLVGGPKVLEYGQGIKLYTLHEFWLVCPTHVLFKFNRAVCTRPQCLLCQVVHKRPPQWWRHSRLLDAAIGHVDAFIAPSRFTRDKHHEMGLDVPIVHLPYFVPQAQATSSMSEGAISETPQAPYFLFVGRLEKLKGLQTLIPVFRDYDKARLLIAGKGSYEPRLRRLAGSSAKIRFLGYASGHELRALYRKAVAVIVPSLCFDVSPQVVIEAFMEQTPAIVGDLGGMPEIIAESGGGFVYAKRGELVAAMDQLLADAAHRDELGRCGYHAYRRIWTAEAHLKRYLALIDEIAAARGRPFPWDCQQV